MSADTLNPVPQWKALAWNQVRMLTLLQRRELVILGVLAAGFLLLALHGLGSFEDHSVAASGPRMMPVFLPTAMPLLFIAALWPLGVWRHDPPSGRGYFWSLPIARGWHTLLRVAVGWAMLMAACLAVMALVAAVAQAYAARAPSFEISFMLWYLPLMSSTLAYASVSALVVAVDRPVRVAWVAVALLALRIVAGVTGLTGIQRAMGWVSRSFLQAFWGPFTVFSPDHLALTDWQSHYGLWLAAALVSLLAGAFIHREV